jgi:hypothetical protein
MQLPLSCWIRRNKQYSALKEWKMLGYFKWYFSVMFLNIIEEFRLSSSLSFTSLVTYTADSQLVVKEDPQLQTSDTLDAISFLYYILYKLWIHFAFFSAVED